jgi:hypothetical protein
MAEHKMPAGIERVEKGLYRSHDGAIEIVQREKGWTAKVLEVPEGRAFAKGEVLTEKPLRTRGDVVSCWTSRSCSPRRRPSRRRPRSRRSSRRARSRRSSRSPALPGGSRGPGGP